MPQQKRIYFLVVAGVFMSVKNMKKNTIIDLRTQKRIIKIKLENIGCDFNLDDFIDELITDLKVIYEQRKMSEGLKIKIILE